VKLIIASIVVLSVVVFFLFALFPSDISVSRIININQNEETIHKTIADLQTWKNWNVMIDLPPKTNGSSVFVTDSVRLVSRNVTVCLLKITGDTIFTKWQNGAKFFFSEFVLSKINNQVVVEWTMHFHLHWYPWEKLAGMFYDKELGPQMEQSLLNLQKISETSNTIN
jgi:hypothetical protein